MTSGLASEPGRMSTSEGVLGGTWGDRAARTGGFSQQHPARPYTPKSLNQLPLWKIFLLTNQTSVLCYSTPTLVPIIIAVNTIFVQTAFNGI